ncbi:MAG: SDR family oxidoreductase [Myxococcales bacterium]|nr:SDR family oxidoreductase [Myxococcales bacterium]
MPIYDSVFRADLFAGKVALITGGGTGIGRCIAHELAALGCSVVVSGRRPEPLKIVVGEVTADGGKCEALPLNIRDDEAVDAAIAELVKRHGRLDFVVNNAGGQFAADAATIRPKGWRAVIDTNLNGTWWVSQSAHRHWMQGQGGAIVNVIADMWNGFPGMAHTGAARAAVDNLTKSLAIEWAADGVRVNAVAPGYVLSSGLHNYPEDIMEVFQSLMVKNPAARLGTEAEISSAVVWLLSAGAAYVTGHTVRVDGAGSLAKQVMFPLASKSNLPIYNGFHRASDVPNRFLGDADAGQATTAATEAQP